MADHHIGLEIDEHGIVLSVKKSRMRSSAMEAGREFDALVAELVMERKVVETSDGPQINKCVVCGEAKESDEQKGHWFEGLRLLHYSTGIAAAWEVVSKLKDRSPTVFWGIDNSLWWCRFEHPIEVSACADTAPLAICLAALKAVGITE